MRIALMAGPLIALLGSAADLSAQTPPASQQAFSILKEKCFQCHGETLQMAKLNLQSSEAMLKGGEKGPAVVPGNAESSRLYRRVAGLEQPRMPMAPLAALTPAEIETLKNWIDSGAKLGAEGLKKEDKPAGAKYGDYTERTITKEDREWWAFRKTVRHPVPQVSDARWSVNPIDAFVKKTLDSKGLAPAPQADRNTLVRRVYLDLIGLLPKPEEVDAFVQDRSPKAYENLVERLLASPQYGERWGRFWLDVVRYADSSGYEMDADISNAWR